MLIYFIICNECEFHVILNKSYEQLCETLQVRYVLYMRFQLAHVYFKNYYGSLRQTLYQQIHILVYVQISYCELVDYYFFVCH